MKKLYWEILLAVIFVVGGTILFYDYLAEKAVFWNAQTFWSFGLILCWLVVAFGYYHQGWLVHKGKSADHVSAVLPSAVFLVQCILFVKGVYYHDWSLIAGAILVNSGVVFSLYQIWKARRGRS